MTKSILWVIGPLFHHERLERLQVGEDSGGAVVLIALRPGERGHDRPGDVRLVAGAERGIVDLHGTQFRLPDGFIASRILLEPDR